MMAIIYSTIIYVIIYIDHMHDMCLFSCIFLLCHHYYQIKLQSLQMLRIINFAFSYQSSCLVVHIPVYQPIQSSILHCIGNPPIDPYTHLAPSFSPMYLFTLPSIHPFTHSSILHPYLDFINNSPTIHPITNPLSTLS